MTVPVAARRVTAVGLAAGAIGILVLRLSGAEMPAIPPGLVLLVAAAALVAFSQWRWAPIVGVLVALSEILGYVLSGAPHGLFTVGPPGVMTGSWVRGIGIGVAVVAGITAALTEPKQPERLLQ